MKNKQLEYEKEVARELLEAVATDLGSYLEWNKKYPNFEFTDLKLKIKVKEMKDYMWDVNKKSAEMFWTKHKLLKRYVNK